METRGGWNLRADRLRKAESGGVNRAEWRGDEVGPEERAGRWRCDGSHGARRTDLGRHHGEEDDHAGKRDGASPPPAMQDPMLVRMRHDKSPPPEACLPSGFLITSNRCGLSHPGQAGDGMRIRFKTASIRFGDRRP